MNLREHEPLRCHTTLRTGGPARFFVQVTTEDEAREALQFARQRHLPVFVLGSGSNVLAGDGGFDGLVLKMAMCGLRANPTVAGSVEVIAEAGEEWDALVAFAVKRAFFGLENMSLIPGTVGAAVVGNIGAYGAEVKDTLLWVDALDARSGAARRFGREECKLTYRGSFFKTAEGRHFILTRGAFSLGLAGRLNLRYKDVAEHFASRGLSSPTLASLREAVISIRQQKLPDLSRVGTAGSFFKNPVLTPSEYAALALSYPGLPAHQEADRRVKVSLGWILDKVCGLRGVRQGRVGTHSEQALVLVNEGGTAAEVEAFATEITLAVKARTGLVIEWEVERISTPLPARAGAQSVAPGCAGSPQPG
jgi:UDP-N-acetylmuramate dehydrogenase